MTHIIFALISAAIMTTFLVWVSVKHGIQKSWSASVYVIRENKYFMVTLFLTGTAAFIAHPTPLMFVSLLGLFFVGVYRDYRNCNRMYLLHGIAAIISAAAVIIDTSNYLWLAGLPVLYSKNRIFWIETIIFYTTIYIIIK